MNLSFRRRQPEVGQDDEIGIALHGEKLKFSFFPNTAETVAPPDVLRDPAQLTNLSYKEYAPRTVDDRTKFRYLERPWKARFRNQPEWFGGSQHHELLYRIAKGDIPHSSKDVLVNIDAHHDTGYESSGRVALGPKVNKGSFVSHGFQAQAWGEYIFVPAESKAGEQSSLREKTFPIEVSAPRSILPALEMAVKKARVNRAKVIVTIDFDFFVGDYPKVVFQPERTLVELKSIVDFLAKHRDQIRCVFWCESPEFTKDHASQKMMYQMLARLLAPHQ